MKKWVALFLYFGKFLCFFFLHIFKLLALGFKEKNSDFFNGLFGKKIISLNRPPCVFNESFGRAIYVKMSRQESAVR